MNKFQTISLVLIVVLVAGLLGFNTRAASSPELPRVYLDTSYPSLPPDRTVFTVKASCSGESSCFTSLQSAIDQAKLGDEVVIDAGLSITGPITLKNKSTGSGWIVIRSSALSDLPPNERVSPSNSTSMAKILSPGSNQSALVTENGAHHYWLAGLEFAKISPAAAETNLIHLGSAAATSTSVLANNLVLDRIYAHGDPTSNLRRCITLNSASTAIINSYISDCHEIGADAQAIGGWNGPGPFKIANNYLEGSGENVLFGGADPKIANLVPSDIEFRNNYVFKPLSWKIGHETYAGKAWTVKNSFELKNAQRVLVDGNIFKNNWVHGQPGFAILFTPRNQDGTCSWCVVADVTFTNNVVESSSSGFNILGMDDILPSQRTSRILIKNNLLLDLDKTKWGGGGFAFQSNGVMDLTIDHNTIFQTGNIMLAYGETHSGFSYTNNITGPADYGFFGSDTSEGNGALTKYFPGAVFEKNVLTGRLSSRYPSGNYFPADFTAVGFQDYPNGNYSLASDSPYKGQGTSSSDIGADYAQIKSATQNVISGKSTGVLIPAPSPTPPPPPPSSGGGSTTVPPATETPPVVTVPAMPLFPDGSLLLDLGVIYIMEYGLKRPFASMGVFSGFGFKLSNVRQAATNLINMGSGLFTSKQRHPRGVLVEDKGTVYFMGADYRYPFPSEEVFYSWGNQFKDVVKINSYDLAVPIGPVVEMKK